ncbi:MAG: DMT family transporter [Actinomycetota bacterium]
MTERSEHGTGLLLGSIGVAIIIPDATLIRLVDAPSTTTAVWRTGLAGIVLVIYLALRYRRGLPAAVRAMGPWGIAASAMAGAGTILFVLSIDSTAVANVVLLLALTPLWAALLTGVVLGQQIAARTWWAIPPALIGVFIAVVGPGGLEASSLRGGDLLAVLTSLILAGQLTVVRARSEVDMVPAVAVGNLAGCLTLLAAGAAVTLEPGDLLPAAAIGLIVAPGALAFMTAGARRLSSPEMSLLLLAETALSPLLAAAVVGEEVRAAAYVGGVIVIATLVAHTLAAARAAEEPVELAPGPLGSA